MAMISPNRFNLYRGAVPQLVGDPIVTTTTLEPGYAYEITLPASSNVSTWTVQFARDGVVFQTNGEIAPWAVGGTPTKSGYIFTTADVAHDISATVIAVPYDTRYVIDPIPMPAVTVASGGGGGSWPADISQSLVGWTQRDAGVVAGVARGRATFDASIVPDPTGYKLCVYRAPLNADGTITVYAGNVKEFTAAAPTGLGLVPGGVWDPNNGATYGARDGLILLWKRNSDGAYQQMAWISDYQAKAPGVVAGPSTQPTADATLGSASMTALTAALNALPAKSGWRADSEGPYYILDLPSGNYAGFNFNGRIAAATNGRVILRSQDRDNVGAKFTSGQMIQAQGIEFHFCNFDRTGLGYIDTMVNMREAKRCGFRWNNIYFGPNVRNSLAQGWAPTVGTGFDLWENSKGAGSADRAIFYMNYLRGGADQAIYTGGATNSLFEENVFADISGDDIHNGGLARYNRYINNWGSRRKYPAWDGSLWKHTDFIQFNSKSYPTPGNSFVGNVHMANIPAGVGIPSQGIFGSGSIMTDSHVENNIVLTHTPNAIMFEPTRAGMAGNRILFNTSLLLIDDLRFSTHHQAKVTWGGAAEWRRNVQCMTPYEASFFPGYNGSGLGSELGYIFMTNKDTRDYTQSLAWYTNPRMGVSFYDLRPVAGTPAHWAYSGPALQQGAYQRFEDVIVGGAYPKEGPAAAGWKASFDPANQITS